MTDCDLRYGRDQTEMILRVQKVPGHYYIGLNKARVLGQEVGLEEGRLLFLSRWLDTKQHKLKKPAPNWKSGPVVENYRNLIPYVMSSKSTYIPWIGSYGHSH